MQQRMQERAEGGGGPEKFWKSQKKKAEAGVRMTNMISRESRVNCVKLNVLSVSHVAETKCLQRNSSLLVHFAATVTEKSAKNISPPVFCCKHSMLTMQQHRSDGFSFLFAEGEKRATATERGGSAERQVPWSQVRSGAVQPGPEDSNLELLRLSQVPGSGSLLFCILSQTWSLFAPKQEKESSKNQALSLQLFIGTGNSKKSAKISCAEQCLKWLGLDVPGLFNLILRLKAQRAR